MINIVIVEDEPDHQREIVTCLNNMVVKFKISAICATIDEAFEAIEKHKPEIVFLDIRLAFGQNGFDLLKRFTKRSFTVIVTSVHSTFEYACSAYHDFSVFYFLKKPVESQELSAVLKKYIKCSGVLSEPLVPAEKGKWFITREGRINIEPDNILYCKSEYGTTCIFLATPIANVTQVLTSIGIGEIETMLENFRIKRAHNQYLVNLNFVKGYSSGGNTASLIMFNRITGETLPKKIPVSKEKKSYIRGLLGM